jgi:molybdate transport system substrate-binding protein
MSSIATREVHLALVPQFEKTTGCTVQTQWVGMVDIRKRLAAGEVVDLVSATGSLIDELIQSGSLVPGSRTDLARSKATVAVRKGAAKPDISSGDAVKRALLAAKTVGYSSGPSGEYLIKLFERMGIAAELKGKTTQTPPGVPVGGLIEKGEVELGFQQMSELLPFKGLDIVGPLPADIELITTFALGLHARAKEPEAARALMKFLTSKEAAPVLREKGMEPA